MPIYDRADGGEPIYSDRELTDAELHRHSLRRQVRILQPGESLRLSVAMMDSLQLDVSNTMKEHTMRQTIQMTDELRTLKDAADAAYVRSVTDLNAWREQAPGPTPATHDEQSASEAYARSVADLNAWRK